MVLDKAGKLIMQDEHILQVNTYSSLGIADSLGTNHDSLTE